MQSHPLDCYARVQFDRGLNKLNAALILGLTTTQTISK